MSLEQATDQTLEYKENRSHIKPSTRPAFNKSLTNKLYCLCIFFSLFMGNILDLSCAEVRIEKLIPPIKQNSLFAKLQDSPTKQNQGQNLVKALTKTLIVISISLFLFFTIRFIINRFERTFTPKEYIRESEQLLRLKTIGNLLRWLNQILISCFAILSILGIFGIDTSFLLASAGIIGVAVGFGGQYLIRDIITGIFIIIEGQYRINDVIQIGDLSGLVEDLNLRITTLRDLEGRVIIIPNGEIKTVINLTKGHSYALLDIGIAYRENIDNAITAIKEVTKELRRDKDFKHLITSELEMFGVDELADSQVKIKFRIKTLPIKQWEVARELRKRIKNKFDELGIEIPFPHTTVYFANNLPKSVNLDSAN